MSEPYRVFWQPGCSSCLKAKEFLTGHGIAFESVNVLADDDGMEALQALGARSVPVVSRGRDFVFAQSLTALADFVGVSPDSQMLPVHELVHRVVRVLTVARSHARQLPLEVLNTALPGRDRTYLDLAYHIPVIVEAFLIAARGGTLTFDLFERRPPPEIQSGPDVAEFGSAILEDFQRWWSGSDEGADLPVTVKTYYGDQPIEDLLERTAWHAAQHTRQLSAVLEALDIALDDQLVEKDIEGLPLPNHVYDDQVPLEAHTA